MTTFGILEVCLITGCLIQITEISNFHRAPNVDDLCQMIVVIGHASCTGTAIYISRPSKLQKPPATYQIAPDSSINYLAKGDDRLLSLAVQTLNLHVLRIQMSFLKVSTQATVALVADPVFITVCSWWTL